MRILPDVLFVTLGLEVTIMAKIRVLVYGTLKSGQGNFRVMQEAQGVSLGSAWTLQPDFFLIDLGVYPAAVPAKSDQGTVVQGELFELDEENLPILDRLEGFPHNYDRKEIPVEYGYQVHNADTDKWEYPTCMAWMYFINPRGWMGGRDVVVCLDGKWFPTIRRSSIDLTELTDSDYVGASIDYPASPRFREDDDETDYDDGTYYETHFGPAIQIGVDGDEDLHGYIEDAIGDVEADLSKIEESEDEDTEWGYIELNADGAHLGIDGHVAAFPVIRKALAQYVELEEWEHPAATN
jgi:gamma-glutamylcyclotransferase (GGCT)/AIG2-like uncharacterized protein YtfP